jgi:hypothetical protein
MDPGQPARRHRNPRHPLVSQRCDAGSAAGAGQFAQPGDQDPPGRHYRALIFVNGWQMGHYIADMGPQSRFPIPSGVLDGHGVNHIAIAVWKTDDTQGGLGHVSLIDEGSFTAPDTAR